MAATTIAAVKFDGLVTPAAFVIENHANIAYEHEGWEDRDPLEGFLLPCFNELADFLFLGFFQFCDFAVVEGLVLAEEILPFGGEGFIGIRRAFFNGCLDAIFSQLTDDRATKDTHCEHPDARDGIQCQCAPFRALFGNNPEHGWPEESFPEAVKGCEKEDHEQSLC